MMATYTQPSNDKALARRIGEAAEQLPDTPEKTTTGRFSEGIEQLPETPETPEKTTTGRFSAGIEQPPGRSDKTMTWRPR